MQPTDITVAALIEKHGRFLIIEETAGGRRVLTQPGGHIEAGESPEQAAQREVAEESGFNVAIHDLVGAYTWVEDNRRQCLRIVFVASLREQQPSTSIDDSIHAVHWFSYAELVDRQDQLRSPSVLRCIDDFVAGERQPRSLFAACAELDEQLDIALTNAHMLTA